jgi:hypothetical protein
MTYYKTRQHKRLSMNNATHKKEGTASFLPIKHTIHYVAKNIITPHMSAVQEGHLWIVYYPFLFQND